MRGSPALRVVLVCLLLVGSASGAVAGATSDQAEAGLTVSGDSDRLFQQDTETPDQNNSSTQHEDPDSVDENGDSERVQSYLMNSLAQRLQGSTLNLSQGEYDRARELVGEEYRDDLGKYVDVAGETEESAATETFETVRDDQESYVNQTQSYRETKADYEDAVEEGNETRARELARELVQISSDVNSTGRSLNAGYGTLGNQTGVNFSTEQAQIGEITQNITADADEIAQTQFTQTRLSVSIDNETISFLDPATLSGRLVTDNGSALANQTVTVAVAGRQVTVETNASGAFTTQYRPTAVRLDRETLPVQYVPDESTVYLASNGSVPVEIRQVTANTTVSGPSSGAFDETVTVSGRVDADGIAVAGVPVRVRLGGVTLGTVRTNASGEYTLSTSLPANVGDGSRQLTASVALSERAITSSAAETDLRVESTATTLRVTASSSEVGTGEVSGQLETVDGTAIPGRSVDIQVGGTTVATVDTDSEGRFSTRIDVPNALSEASQVTVIASFDGAGTNLEESQTNTTLVLAEESTEGSTGDSGSSGAAGSGVLQTPLGDDLPILGGAGVLLLVSAAGVYLLVRRSNDSSEDETAEATATTTETTSDEATVADRSPVAAAEEHLETDHSVAVELAFARVREHFEDRYGIAPSFTHREFARACRSAGLSETAADALDNLTDVYERAAFGPTGVSREDARTALTTAKTLLN